MTLQETLQKDSLAARLSIKNAEDEKTRQQAQNKSKLLSTLLAEITLKGKDTCNGPATDEQAVKIVKKFIDGAQTLATAFAARGEADREAEALQEMEWLKPYLSMGPQVLSEAETRKAIDDLIAQGVVGIGPLMAALRKEYGARLDSALASKLAKG